MLEEPTAQTKKSGGGVGRERKKKERRREGGGRERKADTLPPNTAENTAALPHTPGSQGKVGSLNFHLGLAITRNPPNPPSGWCKKTTKWEARTFPSSRW